jgi:hypothetical protein
MGEGIRCGLDVGVRATERRTGSGRNFRRLSAEEMAQWRGNELESDSGMNGFHAPPMKSRSFNLRGDRNELGYSPLDEIAKAIRTLTYGEMLELAEAMWKVNSRRSEITESDLPGVLHRWSASQR